MSDDRLQSCDAGQMASWIPEPPVLSLSQVTGRGPAGYSLASCPGLVSGKEEGRSGGGVGGWSYIALWRAGFASLFPWQRLSYSIQPWDGLCIWKQFPVVSQALSLFSSTALSSSLSSSTVSLFLRAAALHLHLLLYFLASTSNIISIWIRAEVCLCSLFKFPKTTRSDF